MYFTVWLGTLQTDESKQITIGLTILAHPFIRMMLLFGFVVELARFTLVPALNHPYFVVKLNTMYDCPEEACSNRPDFVVVAVIFRLFVAIATINNIVLLTSILSDQKHVEISLSNITKTINAVIFVLLLFALAMDLRVYDDTTSGEWDTLYVVVNCTWSGLHIFGFLIILKSMAFTLYRLEQNS